MPKDFDLMALLAGYAKAKGVPLTDPTITERFAADAVPRLQRAIRDRGLVFGMRTERLFEAMVISLGKFRLFKSEDNGTVHGANTLRAPDFRIVLETGEQWLVEVKNVHRENPVDQVHEMTPDYVESLRAYGDAVGVPVMIAHFWSVWEMWTLVEISRFKTKDGGFRIGLAEAMMHSRLSDLGDVSISLPPPLRLVGTVRADAGRNRANAKPTGAAALYRGAERLTDPRDQRLATILLLYGEWRLEGPTETQSADGERQIELLATPEEASESGIDRIGSASRIFSRYYRSETSAGTEVTQLQGEARPEWFQPLAKWDFESSKLALRLFHLRPPSDEVEREA